MAEYIRMPQFGVSMETGTISQWFKSVGDAVRAGEVVASIETEKLTNDVLSDYDGVIIAIVAPEGAELPIQGLMAVVGAPGEKWEQVEQAAAEEKMDADRISDEPAAVTEAKSVSRSDGRIKASPFARKLAASLGINLGEVKPSGTSGRVKSKDIYAFAEQQKKIAEAVAIAAETAKQEKNTNNIQKETADAFPVKNLELMDGDTVEKISGIREVVARRMFESVSEIPSVTQTVKVDVTELIELRKNINEHREQKLSLNDFILKAVAKALRMNPYMLVSLDGKQIIHRAHVNIGMAVALERGLIVPVIIDADKMSLEAISCAAKDLAARARDGHLGADEYKGSTFTVSNLGMFGVESFTPIINQPDAAILGVCAVQEELKRAKDGTIQDRQVMRISLTFDHRLLDGADAARFEMCVKELLESPMKILL